MANQVSQEPGADALFTQYIDVLNRVLGENRTGFYGRAAKLWSRTFGDMPIAVGIYDDDASQPHHWYTIKLRDGSFELVAQRKSEDAELTWKIDEAHLSHVVGNPQEYIEHPVKLDLDWLATRLGLRQ